MKQVKAELSSDCIAEQKSQENQSSPTSINLRSCKDRLALMVDGLVCYLQSIVDATSC
jgi:hypothetical protein